MYTVYEMRYAAAIDDFYYFPIACFLELESAKKFIKHFEPNDFFVLVLRREPDGLDINWREE